jgi:prepilin-type processing-associated H-X9-DG protein
VAFTTYLGVEGESWAYPDGILFHNSSIRVSDVTDGTSHTTLIGERPPSSTGLVTTWWGTGGQSARGSGESVLGEWEKWIDLGTFPGHCEDRNYHFRPGRLGDPCGDLHFWSLHPRGANFAFADGSVRFMSYAAGVVDRTGDEPVSVMHSLATRAGGEPVSHP